MLQQYITPEYIESLQKLDNNRPRVKVYVEGESDLTFWNSICKKLYPDILFDISIYRVKGKKEPGKCTILKKVNLGYNILGCVDADLDVVACPLNHHTNLTKTDFVIHTHCHGVENALLHPDILIPYLESKDDVCKAIADELKQKSDLNKQRTNYEYLLDRISMYMYDFIAFLIHLQLIKEHDKAKHVMQDIANKLRLLIDSYPDFERTCLLLREEYDWKESHHSKAYKRLRKYHFNQKNAYQILHCHLCFNFVKRN